MINKRASHITGRIVSLLLLIVLVISTLPVNMYSYADEVKLYDTYPTINGTEGTMARAEKVTVGGSSSGGGDGPSEEGPSEEGPSEEGPSEEGPSEEGPSEEGPSEEGPSEEGPSEEGPSEEGPSSGGNHQGNTGGISFWLVKLPQGTTKIRFYGGNATQFSIPDYTAFETHKGKVFDQSTYCNNGWWTIDVADLEWDYLRYSSVYNNGLTKASQYCKQAAYYELINSSDQDNHFFIQIGDSNSPLDVLAAEDKPLNNSWTSSSFNGNTSVKLKLCTGRRSEPIESGQDIYYTTDGSNPTTSSTSKKYTEGFTVTHTCYVKAATKTQNTWGTVRQFVCKISTDVPVISPAGGYYKNPVSVSIKCNADVETAPDIYYTTDGSNPDITNQSQKYSGPFTVSNNTTVKAVSAISGIASAVKTVQFDFTTGIDIEFNGNDQGVWLQEQAIHIKDVFNTYLNGAIVTPNGHSKCNIIVSAANGSTVKLNGQEIQPESNGENIGKYLLSLDVQENAADNDKTDGKENSIIVTNGNQSTEYKIYCIASKYADVPHKVIDYFVPASQYTNNNGRYGTEPNRTLIGKPKFDNGSSLGNFGGYITWYYVKGIKNDEKNPYGVDFIVIGNSNNGSKRIIRRCL